MNATSHLDYMRLALQLAERGRFTVSPNPMVGCVIVKDYRIVGEGFHQHAGEAHAEIVALQHAGNEAQNATAYVTLEPCSHYGRTPPCVDALIRAGIKQVYAACVDPNPLVAGKGIAALEAAGIEVHIGLCEAEAKQLNQIFFHYIQHKRPFVIAKWAMSLDGKTITHPSDNRQISCEQSLYSSHQIRQQVDALLIGARTAIQDDPLLTVRYTSQILKHPLRIILASRGVPLDLKMFHPDMPRKTIVATTDAIDKQHHQAMLDQKIEVVILPSSKQGYVDLTSLLDELGKRQITSLLVEGGMTVHENFFAENLVNQVHVYLAPVFIGSLEKKRVFTNIHFNPMEADFYFIADDKGDKHV